MVDSTSLSLSLSLSDTQIKQPDQQATGIRLSLDTPGIVNGSDLFVPPSSVRIFNLPWPHRDSFSHGEMGELGRALGH